MIRLFGPNCPTSLVEAGPLAQIPPEALWVDLLNPTREEEVLAERVLGLDIPTREEMAEIEPSSRLFQRKGVLFMTASVLHGIKDSKPDTDPIGFILSDKVLVTVRYVDPRPFVLFAEHLQSEPDLGANPGEIFMRLLDTIVDRLADELEATGREIEAISAQVFSRQTRPSGRQRNPELKLEAVLLRLGAVQRLLAEIRESAVSTGRMLGFFASSELAAGAEVQRRLDSLQGDVRGLLDHSNALGDNLTFLLNASLGLISLEQNFVMKIFSVAAVVLMPPTLIAGIYGMNFEHMPELEWLLGYPFALGLILLSAILPYWIARRRGWL
ncbi:MAG TPA: magnesium transporter CorA family protein [Sphingomicrobium sp.]|nr:magnesium transporter CorA family protein [Sphingomicrobium sp.]